MADQRAKLMPPALGPGAGYGRSILPDVGSTEHIMLLLVIAEVALLILIRRTFSAAHGG